MTEDPYRGLSDMQSQTLSLRRIADSLAEASMIRNHPMVVLPAAKFPISKNAKGHFEPISDLGGGNTVDAAGVERYRGYSAEEALDAAVKIGTDEAWDWLCAWHSAALEDDDGPQQA